MPFEIHPIKIKQLRKAYSERYGSPTFLGDDDISYLVNGQLSVSKSEDHLTELVLPAMHKYALEKDARTKERAGS